MPGYLKAPILPQEIYYRILQLNNFDYTLPDSLPLRQERGATTGWSLIELKNFL